MSVAAFPTASPMHNWPTFRTHTESTYISSIDNEYVIYLQQNDIQLTCALNDILSPSSLPIMTDAKVKEHVLLEKNYIEHASKFYHHLDEMTYAEYLQLQYSYY